MSNDKYIEDCLKAGILCCGVCGKLYSSPADMKSHNCSSHLKGKINLLTKRVEELEDMVKFIKDNL